MEDNEKNKPKLNITVEAANRIRQLRPDYERRVGAAFDSLHRIADGVMQISQMRTSFYEKLILLAGGSFALTLSFVGSLQPPWNSRTRNNGNVEFESGLGLPAVVHFLELDSQLVQSSSC
jgi:hypothetical protein